MLCSESMIQDFQQTQRISRQLPPFHTSRQSLTARQQFPRMRTPSFVSLQPNGIGNDNNGCSDYKSLPTLPSSYSGTEPNFENQDYLDTPNTLSNKRRSEVQLPQRERGSSTKDVPRSERDMAMKSKRSSSSQSKSAQSVDDGGRKNGQVTNRPSKPSRYDTSKDLTKTVSLMYPHPLSLFPLRPTTDLNPDLTQHAIHSAKRSRNK